MQLEVKIDGMSRISIKSMDLLISDILSSETKCASGNCLVIGDILIISSNSGMGIGLENVKPLKGATCSMSNTHDVFVLSMWDLFLT